MGFLKKMNAVRCIAVFVLPSAGQRAWDNPYRHMQQSKKNRLSPRAQAVVRELAAA
jgi:hypothetical protein